MTLRHRSSGFSLIELIVAIVIAGILAAVATARFVGRGGFESRAYFDEALGVVRQAQRTAIAQRRNVVLVVSADRIAACYAAACNAGTHVVAGQNLNRSGVTATNNCSSDTTWLCAGRPSGVAALSATTATITFDALGRPSSAATITIPGADAGDITRRIDIQAETGYARQL